MKKFTIAVALLFSAGAYGAEPPSTKVCTTIKEGVKRLACFDAAVKGDVSKPMPPQHAPAPEPEITIPLEIKGIRVGMDANEVRPKFESRDCMTSSCYRFRKYGKAANEFDSFAGAVVEYVRVDFSEDRLVRMNMTMSAGSAGLVFAALSEKYGKAVREENEFKTKGGVTTTQVVNTWTQGDAELVAESPSGKIDEMRITLVSKAQRLKDTEKLKEKALKDL